MYIKNQSFNDEDTLLEMLFDFSLGEPEPLIRELREKIWKDLESNAAFQEYRATLAEEDRLELEAEEQDLRLAEALMEQFDSFRVYRQQLFGVRGTEETLLFSVDLV